MSQDGRRSGIGSAVQATRRQGALHAHERRSAARSACSAEHEPLDPLHLRYSRGFYYSIIFNFF